MARKSRTTHESDDRDDTQPSLDTSDLRTNVRAIEDRRLFTPHPQVAQAISHVDRILTVPDEIRSTINQASIRASAQIRNSFQKKLARSHTWKSLQRTLRSRVVSRRPTRDIPRTIARGVPTRLKFQNPLRVAVCVRRKIRREIMFAKNLRGRGSGGGKRNRKWSMFSEIRCK